MLKRIEEKEVDTFEQEVEFRLANLEDVLLSEYAAGQKSGLEYGLAIYRECQEDDTQLLTFVENNPGCTIQHIDEFAPLGFIGVKELLYSDEIMCKRVNGTPCYFIPSHVEQFSVKQLEKLVDITRKTCELKMKEHSVDRKFFTMDVVYQIGTMAIHFGLGILVGYMMGCVA